MTTRISRLARVAFFSLASMTAVGAFGAQSFAADRDGDWHHEHWRDARHWNGYYHRPDVYYSAPPVVYPPYGYYAQPGISLNLTLPIR